MKASNKTIEVHDPVQISRKETEQEDIDVLKQTVLIIKHREETARLFWHAQHIYAYASFFFWIYA